MAITAPRPVIARFQFKPDRVSEFSNGNEFVELQFDTPQEVTELIEEFGDAIVDVTANINGRVVVLSEQPWK